MRVKVYKDMNKEENIYSISYDLRKPGRNYSDLYDAIKSLDSTFQHPLESNWFVRSCLSADEIYERLRVHIEDDDLLFISAIVPGNRQGWMVRTFWDWINNKKQ